MSEGEIEIKVDGAGETKVVPPEEGIASLKEQIERSKADSAARLAAAQRQIEEASARAANAERVVAETRKVSIDTTIESLQKDKERAKGDYKAALEIGDYDKAADAQDRLSAANARIVAAEQGRQIAEEEAKAPRQTVPQFVDQVEKVARELPPASANWVRNHPDYITDLDKNAQMVRAHHAAIGDGHAPETAGYFAFINKRLGLAREDDQAPPRRERRDESEKHDRAPISAPVGRDVSAMTQGQSRRPDTITLTPSQAKAAMMTLRPLYPKATDMEIYKIYAENMIALQDEGKIA